MKVCSKCKVEKPLDEFWKMGGKRRTTLRPRCKTCILQDNRTYYNSLAGREKMQKYQKEYLRRPGIKERRIGYQLKQNYGIGLSDKVEMWIKQGKSCAICQKTLLTLREAKLDHCHETGRIRKILCYLCNTGLGCFKDNTKLLQSAISYLDPQST